MTGLKVEENRKTERFFLMLRTYSENKKPILPQAFERPQSAAVLCPVTQ